MAFLFIDRVLVVERGRRILATRGVALDEPFFAHHFPARPVMPASLLLECFAQAATILIETSLGFQRKAFPGYVTNAKFRREVVPGHEITVEMEAQAWSQEGAMVRGSICQRGACCATVTLGMVTAPLDLYYAAEHAPTYRALYRGWLAEARFEGFDRDPLEVLENGDH